MTDDRVEDRIGPPDPFDPFGRHRDGAGVCPVEVAGERIHMVVTHAGLRETARRHEVFSNDAPFRVPIPSEEDVRSVRQLPIETDPPAHTRYREVVRRPFSRLHATSLEPDIDAVVAELLDTALAADEFEVIRDFALPLQSRALALMLDLSRDHADRWIGWGTHVFRDLDAEEGHASELDAYIAEQIARVRVTPAQDFFGLLADATVEGRRLTDEEITGFANLTFAGGRDTVINMVTNGIWWLAGHPAELQRLRGNPELVKTAVEEILRFFSPLTHIGRVVRHDVVVGGVEVPAGDRISLGFAAANRDPAAFDEPDRCRLDRFPNRHVAFGHGPHTCLGAPLARAVMAAVLAGLAQRVTSIEIIDAVPNAEDLGVICRQVGFAEVRVALREKGPSG